MKRSMPMKRTGFKRPAPERTPRQLYRLARPCRTSEIGADATPSPKITPTRSPSYRRLVASLPCIRCKIEGFSQAAHPNTGKGMGTKADDLLCFPLCGPRPGEPGCHALFDQHAAYTKSERRRLEIQWAQQTQERIARMKAGP